MTMAHDVPSDAEWEDAGTAQTPTKGSAVQSVRFTLRDLRAIREAARRMGVNTSEFIRDAAIGRAAGITDCVPQVTWGTEGPSLNFPTTQTESTAPRIRELAAS